MLGKIYLIARQTRTTRS